MPQKLYRVLRLYKELIAGFQAYKRDIRGIVKRVNNTEARLAQIQAIADQLSPLLRHDYERNRLNESIGSVNWLFDDKMNDRVNSLLKWLDEGIKDFKDEWELYESKRGLESFYPDNPDYQELEPTEEEKIQEEAKGRKILDEMLEKQRQEKKESHLRSAIDLMEDL